MDLTNLSSPREGQNYCNQSGVPLNFLQFSIGNFPGATVVKPSPFC